MKTGYVPLQTSIGQFISDFGIKGEEIDPELFAIWGEDATAEISTDEQLCMRIGILDVDNFKAEKPKDFKILCEIAYRKEKPQGCGSRREEIVKLTQKVGADCEIDIHIKCPKCKKQECKGCGHPDHQQPIYVETDRIWELANSYYNHSTEFMTNEGVQTFGRGRHSSRYSNSFQLMRPADTSWFQLQKHIPNCANVHCQNCEQTYMLNKDAIEVDFKKGELLVSYLATYTDENGNLMIPDHRSAIEAVTLYIGMKYYFRKMMMSNDRNDVVKYQMLKQESDIAIGRARSALQIPDIQSWGAWLRDNRKVKLDSALDNLYHGRTKQDDMEDRMRHRGSNLGYRSPVDKFRN